jgi:1-acyl-sn-glycerol-3-phosphate acyltransferase
MGLRERGLQEGETVAIMQPTTPQFFYAFFGILLAGGIPVPIYPPFRMHGLEAYAKTEARILNNAEVRMLITFEEVQRLSYLLQAFVPSLKQVTTVNELMQAKELSTPFKAVADNLAFIQYTSGSTAMPKGVALTHFNLLSNIRAYGKAIQVKPDDVAVSWLPLYHDMGLIGMWLGSLYFGIPLVLLTPFTFLNHPERWLWAIHYHRGTLSGAPNFAYELCIRKIDAALLEGLDLSSWRMAANGAEKIYAHTLEQFIKKFSSYGFKRETMLPVYGLAESAVALVMPPLGQGVHIDSIDRKKFEEKAQAEPTTEAGALQFVSCGVPIEGHAVRIVNDDNQILPERHVGHLQFRGPSSMQGYYHDPVATQAVYHEGWIDSGDLAYQAEGQIFITGRYKDLIIKAGRNIYPAEIEEVAGEVKGIRKGCVAAFSVNDAEHMTEQLIIVAETREQDSIQRQQMVDHIKEEVALRLDVVPDQVVLVLPQTVPKTSSGKLQRAACKKMYVTQAFSKSPVPAWLQISKLGLQSIGRKMRNTFASLGKFIYTVYVILLLGLFGIPLYFFINIVSRDTAAKACRQVAKLVLFFSGCKIAVMGLQKLKATSSVIYVSNHASYMDSILMLALLPATTCFVGKKELLSVPLLRTFMRKLGYIGVDRLDFSKGIADTERIEEKLKTHVPILIFAEGTFGYSSGLRPFKLGAFKIAGEMGIPICPIALQGTRSILRGDEKLMRPGRILVTVCDLVPPTGSEWQEVTHLRQVVRAEIAKYCGEPSLDFIAAQVVASEGPRH